MLKNNKSIADKFIRKQMGEYPYLSKRLSAYNGSMGKKLSQILEYAISYGKEVDSQPISYHAFRGYEYMLSFQRMSGLYRGSLETWYSNISMLLALGLLYVHKPERHAADENTPAQNYSVQRALQRSSQTHMKTSPCHWYRFFPYTPERLAEAERRSEKLKDVSVGKINKDVVRDRLGYIIANTAFDTPFNMSSDTETERAVIENVIASQIEAEGYTTKDRVLLAVIEAFLGEPEGELFDECIDDEALKEDQRIRSHIAYTWKAYQNKLFDDMGLSYSASTSAEREAYGLTNKRWIIRRKE